jgi:hypothetical protein
MREWACLAAGVSMLAACAAPPRSVAHADRADTQTGIVADGGGSARDASYAPDPERTGALRSMDGRTAPEDKDYLIPAAEIIAFEGLLNQFDRHLVDHDVYGTNRDSVHRNLHRAWRIDKDPFSMNQFGHPYSGSIYHGFARSSGLTYWEALGYDFAGSALWEVAGETDPPSLNDQINTTFAGSFLGEALFRTANLVLKSGGDSPSTGRTIMAGLIQPSSAMNRLAFGDRFDAAYPDDDPAIFYTLSAGGRRNAKLKDIGVLTDVRRNHGVAAFSLDYGLPGKPGYEYKRPFDYYHFEATATTSRNAIPENIAVRGLLVGTDYRSGPAYSGLWGLYGTYDYFSPEIFKVSSTGLALGTTGQYLMSDKFALQGTALAGGGFTAAGTNANQQRNREYRYGATPQGQLSLRLVWDDIAMFDVTANDYIISGGTGSGDTSGTENVLRAQLSLTVRISGPHAIGLQFVESRRDPRFSGFPNPRQSVGALSLFYTLLGDEHFGVVRR